MVDAWSSTPPTPQDFPHVPADGVARVLDVIQRQKLELDEMRNSLLANTGMSVSPAGLLIDSELRVTGNTRIEGTLSLPAGIIDNEALANPLAIERGSANTDGFTVTTTIGVSYASFTIIVPEGYSRALVKAEAMVFVYNASATGDYLYSRVHVDAPGQPTFSRRLLGDLNASGGCSLTVTKQAWFEGLVGGDTITVWHELYTAFAPMAHASNGATPTAAAFFLR